MNNMLAGWVTYGASESIGLPEEYGIMCVITGVLLLVVAVYTLPKKGKADAAIGAPVKIKD